MKSLLSLALLSVVLVGTVGYAEAYDGDINITKMIEEPIIGDIIPFKGMLIGVEPESTAIVNMVLHNADGKIIHTMNVEVDSKKSLINGVDEVWNFEFEIDTGKHDLLTDTKYIVEVIYEDKIDEQRLFVYPSLEQSIIDTANAKAESSSMMAQESEIPEWVRNIFTFWVEKQISDQELISAIEYLIEIKIINVSNPLG